jgi:hypothetical protein
MNNSPQYAVSTDYNETHTEDCKHKIPHSYTLINTWTRRLHVMQLGWYFTSATLTLQTIYFTYFHSTIKYRNISLNNSPNNKNMPCKKKLLKCYG